MDWATARSVLLVAAANSAIARRDVGDFWPASHVFHFTRAVIFAGHAGTDAADPNAWFAALRRAGAGGVLLAPAMTSEPTPWPRRIPIEDARSMQSPIVEVLGDGADRWRAGRDDFRDGGEKTWSTTYRVISAGERPQRSDMRRVAAELETVASTLADFARRNGLEQFAPSFAGAVACLQSADPLRDTWYAAGYERLLPDLQARRLFGAAASAQVFGGMGAWNDRNPEDEPPEYLALTLRLIAASNAAAQAAANSTFAPS